MPWKTASAVVLAMIVSPLGAADAFTEGDNEVVLDLPPDTQESIWDAIPARLYESHKKDHLTYITPIHDRASLHITLIRFNRALSPHELDRVRQIAEEVVGAHDRIDLTDAITGAHLELSHDKRWIKLKLKETDGVRSLGRMSQHLADEIGRRVKGVTPEKDRAFHISVAHIDAQAYAGVRAQHVDALIAQYKGASVACRHDAPHAVHIKESQGHLAYEDVRPPVFFRRTR